MRPGRPGRSARSGARLWATRPHPSRTAPTSPGSARHRRSGAESRPCRPRPSPSSAGGRRPRRRAGIGVDRRQERRPPHRRRPARASAPPRSWPPTTPTSRRPRPPGMEAGPLDRLRLTDARLAGMADGLRTVAALPDPVGEVLDGWRRPNGLQIERGPGAARRGRDHLREPAQRHQRRRRAVPQVGQRRAPARVVGARCARTSRSPPCCATALAKARPARRRGDARRRHRARGRGRGHAAHRLRRLPHPARRAVAHPEHPRATRPCP